MPKIPNNSVSADKLAPALQTQIGNTALQTQNVDLVGTIPGFTLFNGSTQTTGGLFMTKITGPLIANSSQAVLYSDTANHLHFITSGGDVIVTGSGGFLPLIGGTMLGPVNMGANNLTNVGLLSGTSISRNANDIVSNTSAAVAGNVANFVNANVIVDSGHALSEYLPLAGGTMSGSVSMGGNSITSVGNLMMIGLVNLGTSNVLLKNNQTLTSSIFSQNVSNGALRDTALEFGILSTGVGSLTLPANALTLGQSIRVVVMLTALQSVGDECTFRFYIGGNVCGTIASPATTLGPGLTARLEFLTTIYATGLATTMNQLTISGQYPILGVTSGVAVNVAVSNLLNVSGQWAAASSSDTVTCAGCIIEGIYSS
jgi:hypothetical protein